MKRFHEGKKAFYKGRLDNPYPEDSNDYRDWQNGFNSAYFENKKKLEAEHGTQRQTTKTFA
jgi:hypothetical protein